MKTASEALPSDKSWGLTISCALLLLAWKMRAHPGAALLSLSAAFALALIAFLRPHILHPLNRRWMKLGELLARLTNPIVIGFVFLAVITPFGLLRRALGHASMATGFEPNRETYWIPRPNPSIESESLKRQF